MKFFVIRDKIIPLALFLNLFCAKNCFTIKFEIKYAFINIDGVIWECIFVLYLGSPDIRWNLNYKYGAAGFCCRIGLKAMDEFMCYSKI